MTLSTPSSVTLPRWKRAFPDFDGVPGGIPEGFRDASWRNDAMPSFLNAEMGLRLYVDYPEASRRGSPDAPRFSLYRTDPEGEPHEESLAEGDDWQEILDAVESEARPVPRM